MYITFYYDITVQLILEDQLEKVLTGNKKYK